MPPLQLKDMPVFFFLYEFVFEGGLHNKDHFIRWEGTFDNEHLQKVFSAHGQSVEVYF